MFHSKLCISDENRDMEMQYIRGIFLLQPVVKFFVGNINECWGKWEFKAGSQDAKVTLFSRITISLKEKFNKILM